MGMINSLGYLNMVMGDERDEDMMPPHIQQGLIEIIPSGFVNPLYDQGIVPLAPGVLAPDIDHSLELNSNVGAIENSINQNLELELVDQFLNLHVEQMEVSEELGNNSSDSLSELSLEDSELNLEEVMDFQGESNLQPAESENSSTLEVIEKPSELISDETDR